MAGTSSLNLAGNLVVVTARRESKIALSQIVGQIEAKQQEFNIPAGTTQSVALPFSSGVTEALVVHFYCPKTLHIEFSSSDTTTPGPVRVGIKGHWLMTMAPAEGMISPISVINPDLNNDITLEMVVAAVQDAADTPEFWE